MHHAGKDHRPGANDSLVHNSLFGRIMGNTVRMRPRDPDGYGIGEDITTQRSMAQHDTAWNDVWKVHSQPAGEQLNGQSSKISIKVTQHLPALQNRRVS